MPNSIVGSEKIKYLSNLEFFYAMVKNFSNLTYFTRNNHGSDEERAFSYFELTFSKSTCHDNNVDLFNIWTVSYLPVTNACNRVS